MLDKLRKIIFIFILTTLTGCLAVATTGVTTLGYSVAQERSIGNAIDDATIATKINSYFLRNVYKKLFKSIDVQVQEGHVLLTGSVEKSSTKIEATRLAWQSNGVKEIINEIQVANRGSLTDYAKDMWISTQVRTQIFLYKDIKSINYSIDTVNSVVYIMGIAASEDELHRVNNIASRVSGVAKVISHVRLKGYTGNKKL